jgi:hypothetical protein
MGNINFHKQLFSNDSQKTHNLISAQYNTVSWKPKNWMSNLRNDAPVIELSIPGTHGSAADSSTSFIFNFVPGPWKTQELSIADQLAIGVRFIDLRIKCD